MSMMNPWSDSESAATQASELPTKSFEDDFIPDTATGSAPPHPDKLPDSEEYLGKLGESFNNFLNIINPLFYMYRVHLLVSSSK